MMNNHHQLKPLPDKLPNTASGCLVPLYVDFTSM